MEASEAGSLAAASVNTLLSLFTCEAASGAAHPGATDATDMADTFPEIKDRNREKNIQEMRGNDMCHVILTASVAAASAVFVLLVLILSFV